MEEFVFLIALALALLLLMGPIVLALVAYVRSQRVIELTRRVERLEAAVRTLRHGPPEPVVAPTPPQPAPRPALEPVSAVAAPSASTPAPTFAAFDWEWFIGRKALGWIAVVAIIFAAAFFLRYAFENHWIGPIGRVALAAACGSVLVAAGWYYDRRRGWRLFAQMLNSAGIVLFYLATYSSFGFYHLLPQQSAAPFLLIIVVETMALAVQYDAPALALMAVLGGLLTPVLMRSETDQYVSLFSYLAILDAGVALVTWRRTWPAMTTAALLGTQGLFWSWYGANYHPEKLGAALAFQAAVFLLFLIHGLSAHRSLPPWARWEDLGRWLLNAFFGFLGFYLLLSLDYDVWMGTLAVAMAALYAGLARGMLAARPDDESLFLTTLAISVGFLAAAFPIQADAPWVAPGWAAEASALWWFGLRVRQAPLRDLAAVLALMASFRIVALDLPGAPYVPRWPVLNSHALPAIAASVCPLAAFALTRGLRRGLVPAERFLAAVAEVGGVLQLWLVLTVDLYAYCRAAFGATSADERMAQMALSILWATYATAVLAVGFRIHRPRLRWTALGLYGATVAKVFLLDMAGLDEFYRILAFLILALLLGVAARVYQLIRPEPERKASGAAEE